MPPNTPDPSDCRDGRIVMASSTDTAARSIVLRAHKVPFEDAGSLACDGSLEPVGCPRGDGHADDTGGPREHGEYGRK